MAPPLRHHPASAGPGRPRRPSAPDPGHESEPGTAPGPDPGPDSFPPPAPGRDPGRARDATPQGDLALADTPPNGARYGLWDGSGGDLRMGSLLDQARLRLDAVLDRPVASTATALIVAAALLGGWWLGRPPPVADPVDLIPRSGSASTTIGPDAPAPTGGAGPSTGPAATGSSAPDIGPGVPGGRSGSGAESGSGAGAEPEVVLVHVAGAVARPGVVTLRPGDRLADAVAAAGGPTDEAEVHRLNLAAPVADGMQVRVPVADEEVHHPDGVVAAPPPVVEPTGTGAAPGSGTPDRPPVDLNRADADELRTLHGIGPALAAAIIRHREEVGGFTSVDELLDVPGIGPVTLDRLVDQVTV